MRRISIQSFRSVDVNDPAPGMKAIAEAGFEALDYGFDGYLSGRKISEGDFAPFFTQTAERIIETQYPLKEAAKKYGVEIGQMHASFPLYVYGRDDINEKCFDVIDKTLAVAKFLDCPWVIIHPLNLIDKCGLEEERRINFGYYRRIMPLAAKHGVGVCLENMFGWEIRHALEATCSNFEEANEYVDTLNREAGGELFGFCYDTGHARLLNKRVYESLVLLGNNLKTLHIHENDGWQDMHAMPYTYSCYFSESPESMMNWGAFCRGLAKIGYKGNINFETSGSLAIFPKPTHNEVRALIASCGRYFR
ncbi:MAG: sugar phosphate isomerase/epimerase, partial [Clostridia bacterium]|nr:sugar phosphate isomerase/epimerase [Clostridia bacterium]